MARPPRCPARPRGIAACFFAALLVPLLLACEGERVRPPAGGTGNLAVRLEWRPPATGKEAAGLAAVDRIDLTLHRAQSDGSLLRLAEESVDIAPGQTRFRIEVQAPPGPNTSIEIAASGSSSLPRDRPLPGVLFFGRSPDFTLDAGFDSVTVVMHPFFPVALQGEGSLREGYRLAWRAVAGADVYRVRGFLPGGGELDSIVTDTVKVFAPLAIEPALEAVVFRVRAENAFVAGAFSDSVVVPDVERLEPPSLLSAEWRPDGTIRVEWQDNASEEDGYIIRRRGPQDEGTLDEIGRLGENGFRWDDGGVFVAGGRYQYAVQAFRGELLSAEVLSPPVYLPPGTPQRLTAEVEGFDAILLRWEAPAGIFAETVIERRAGEGVFAEAARLTPSAVSFGDQGLAPATTYGYRLYTTSHGVSSDSALVAVRTPPAAPRDLAAEELPGPIVRLTWVLPEILPDSILVLRSEIIPSSEPNARARGAQSWKGATTSGAALVPIATLPGDQTEYLDAAVGPRRSFESVVHAADDGLLSPESNRARIDLGAAPPLAPTDLTVTALSETEVRLDWTDLASDETSYRVERRAEGDDFAPIADLPPDTESYTDGTVQAWIPYAWRVRVIGPGGEAVSEAVPGRALPPRPTDVRMVAAGAASLDFAWSYGPLRPEQFLPAIRPFGVQTWTELAPVPGTELEATATNLLSRQLYELRVRAAAAGDTSLPSQTGIGQTPPLPPVWSSARFDPDRGVLLTWEFEPPPNPELFQIEWRRLPDGLWTVFEEDPLPGERRQAVFTTYQLGASYEFHLRAADRLGGEPDGLLVPSDWTSIEVDLPGAPPEPPSELRVEATSPSEITISWRDNSTEEEAFLLERRGPDEEDFTPFDPLPANTTSWEDGDLAPRSTYAYRIRARNAEGSYSSYAGPAEDRTWPPRPAGLRAIAADSARIAFAWAFPPPDPWRFDAEIRLPGLAWTPLDTIPGGERDAAAAGLVTRTAYEIRVRASEYGDDSPFSSVLQARTAPPSPVPFSAEWEGEGSAVVFEWGFPSQPDPSFFEIERRPAGSTGWTPIAPSPLPGDFRTTFEAGVSPGDSIAYRIRAGDVYGAGADTVRSRWVHTQVAIPAPPAIPAGLSVERSGGGLRVRWSPGEGGGAPEYYWVWRQRQQNEAYEFLAQVDAPGTEYLDLSVAPARRYTYRVNAFNAAGSSELSEPASATTPGWRKIQTGGSPAQPISRFGHAGTLVPGTSRVYIFGGMNLESVRSDMWSYGIADSSWTPVAYAGDIGPRYQADMSYAKLGDQLFLFGGNGYEEPPGAGWWFDFGSTSWRWACSGDEPYPNFQQAGRTAWIEQTSGILTYGGTYYLYELYFHWHPFWYTPLPENCAMDKESPAGGRSGHFFEAVDDRTVLIYGGQKDDYAAHDDSWLTWWNGSTWSWQQVYPGSSPGARQLMSSAADPARGRAYLLGGYDDFGNERNDVWMVQGPSWTSWTLLDAGHPNPTERPRATDAVLVADPSTGYLYHFGRAASPTDPMEVWLYIP